VATGYPGRTAAVKTNGTLWLWGSLTYGNAGNNLDTDTRSSPVQVGALTNWSKIALGYNTTLAIKTDGTLWAWGHNQYGQLGNNQKAPGYPGTTGRVSSPVQIGTGTNWNNVAINMTFGTGIFTIATKTDGTLWGWGSNDYGALGLGLPNGSLVSSPIQVGSSTNWSLPSVGFTSAGALLRVN
jgi:alpha-tubulin suppressor-like RCC1 family protein